MVENPNSYFESIAEAGRGGLAIGVYSVCCATPLVIEAACEQAVTDGSILLIEATANQVNQFGGYTGMSPRDYIDFVTGIALRVGLAADSIIFGGDHLGPVCWSEETSVSAMEKAERLIEDYARAGFRKLHLDCSMPCADDPPSLSNDVVAARAVRLARVAEGVSNKICYVIGTEVPPPGGATANHLMVPTTGERALATWEAHRHAFASAGLEEPWSRVTALVVQPGVEFGNLAVEDYRAQNRRELIKAAIDADIPLFEAHSTDYQSQAALNALVQDRFGILKVGPQLTFAFREALIALSHIEDWLIDPCERSDLRLACENIMTDEPAHWVRYYNEGHGSLTIQKFFSYSDRIRYYWPGIYLSKIVDKLFSNLEAVPVPDVLISQYFPKQYQSVREGSLQSDPKSLLKAKIRDVLLTYSKACHGQA